MNELYTREFVKQATQAGVPQQKIAALLERASEISKRSTNNASTKTASSFDIVDSLITNAGMQKNASSVSYVQGILNEALISGANIPQAMNFTKQALAETVKKVAFMDKVSAIANNPRLNEYAEGFIAQAKTAGLSQEEAVSLLVDVVDREKTAVDGDPMFKQPSDQGPGPSAPDSDPAAGAPPGGDPSAGEGQPGPSDPQEAQILQMLQSLPPEEQQQIIQQLLAAISGGQGGPGGPGAGGPPPAGAGGPPPGAGPGGPGGAPQPGGPQGPV
jgi:DNA-binding transcriptional regulator YhcF (GntR family)